LEQGCQKGKRRGGHLRKRWREKTPNPGRIAGELSGFLDKLERLDFSPESDREKIRVEKRRRGDREMGRGGKGDNSHSSQGAKAPKWSGRVRKKAPFHMGGG